MVDEFTRWHYIAYACYLFAGAIGFIGILDEAGVVRTHPGAGMFAFMLLALLVPGALLLSVILRKERLLLVLAGLTVGVPVAMWAAAVVSPQDQSIAGWYIIPSTVALLVVPAVRTVQCALRCLRAT